MRVRPGFVSVRPHFGAALIATFAVVVLPALVTGVFVRAAGSAPSPFVAALVSVLLGLIIATAGAAWWSRRPQAKEIGFGELMLWGWWRRKRAEDKLVAGTRSLGLDPSGRPATTVDISREEQVQVLKDLTAALESKDPYTHGHSRRVERHCYRTAAAMGLAIDDIEELRKAAALHDVGKVRVPDPILRKPGPLTHEERVVLEEHSVVGAWMVSTVGSADVISAVRHHHERWDGRGYPDGLASYDIPLYSRIIAVADAYDALTSTRPYRAGVSREEAVAILRADAGTQFDPKVVDCFVASLPDRAAVASLLALLALPGGVLRKMAVTARRVGMANVAPAIGATGAAVVIGAGSLIAPSAPKEAPRQSRVVVEEDSMSSEPYSGRAGLSAPREAERDKKRRPRPDRRNNHRPERPSALVLGDRLRSARPSGTAPARDEDRAPQSSVADAESAPAPRDPPREETPPAPAQPAQEEAPPTEESPPREEPAKEPKESEPNARTDPQPEKGKDCPKEEGQGNGHEYHCGD